MKGKLSINGEFISDVDADFDFTGTEAYTTGGNDCMKFATPTELTAIIKAVEGRKFFIWKGDKRIQILPLKNRPKLLKSDLLNEDKAYVMAGVGIIAGKKAYDYILSMFLALEWSDEFIDPQEQIKNLGL